MKIFVCAGEASGDVILAKVLACLKNIEPPIEIIGLGGEACIKQGLHSFFPMQKLAINGVWDVLKNGLFCLQVFFKVRKELKDFAPEALILVDYPGLNLRLLRYAKKNNIPCYYIAPPQWWAYKNGGSKLKRYGNFFSEAHVHVLYPFENVLFKPLAKTVTVGNFLNYSEQKSATKNALGLFPGSRLGVLKRNLPLWLTYIQAHRQQFMNENIYILVPAFLQGIAQKITESFTNINELHDPHFRVITDKKTMLNQITYAWVFPGTMSLELAVTGIPHIILGIVDFVTFWWGKKALRSSLVGLANMVLPKPVFPEYVGDLKAWKSWQSLDFKTICLRQAGLNQSTTLKIILGNNDGDQQLVKHFFHDFKNKVG